LEKGRFSWPTPIGQAILGEILQSSALQADETPIDYLDPWRAELTA
jgi:hypothetical protein